MVTRKFGIRMTLAAMLGAVTVVVPGAAPAAAAGPIALVSHAASSATTAGDSDSFAPVLSADGSAVVFASSATNLVPGQSDTNNSYDIFLYERATGTTKLVSHVPGSATTTGNGVSESPILSANGARVYFTSLASNLVQGQVDAVPPAVTADVFAYQRATGVVTLVSHVPGNAKVTANDSSSTFNGATSADGAFLAFTSRATNLVAGQTDANGVDDVFLYRRATNSTVLVSHTPGSATTAANGFSGSAPMTTDGQFVFFSSTATNLVTGQIDANNNFDAFLYERATGTVTLVSHVPGNATTTGDNTSGATHDATGAFAVFGSSATNLVPGQVDSFASTDLFLYERATGTVTLVSHVAGNPAVAVAGFSAHAHMSADGAWVAFSSTGPNLVGGQVDTNNAPDAFLYQRATDSSTLVSHVPGNPTMAANNLTQPLSTTPDMASIVLRSFATDLVTGLTKNNVGDDVFLYDRASDTNTLVSHVPGSPTTTGNLFGGERAVISDDGGFVAFESNATNLVAGQTDTNSARDIFLTTITAAVDVSAPTCFVSALITGPPKEQQVTVQDSGSGLAAIENVQITNGTVSVDPFTPGTTSAIVITATKTDPSQSTTWSFEAVDVDGNRRVCR